MKAKKLLKVRHIATDASLPWLLYSVGGVLASTGLAYLKEKKDSVNYFGLWVPTILLIGLHHALIKDGDSPAPKLNPVSKIQKIEGSKIAA